MYLMAVHAITYCVCLLCVGVRGEASHEGVDGRDRRGNNGGTGPGQASQGDHQ